tara:strand:- start:439 stop:630 length:192 start_codon:yes stop_codon:yes gene_type:complete
MRTEEIARYLKENCQAPEVLNDLMGFAKQVERKLDYSCIYEQIDTIVFLVRYENSIMLVHEDK